MADNLTEYFRLPTTDDGALESRIAVGAGYVCSTSPEAEQSTMAVKVPPHLVRQVGLLIGRLHPLGVHHPGTREGSSGWCLGCVPQVGVFIGSNAPKEPT